MKQYFVFLIDGYKFNSLKEAEELAKIATEEGDHQTLIQIRGVEEDEGRK